MCVRSAVSGSRKESGLAADGPLHRLGGAELVVARCRRRRPPVEAPPRDVPHGAGEGELRVQPGGRVEVPAHRRVRPQRRLHAGARVPPQPLAHGLRAEAAHPAPAVRRADAEDVGGRAVLRHAAASAPHRLRRHLRRRASAATAGNELVGFGVVGALRE
jgi:hypothetical protein